MPIFLVFIFLISVLVSDLYVGGDQYLYNDVYEYMQDKSLFESYLYYSVIISKTDFIHFFLSYFGSKLGFDKSIYMSLFNVCLFYTGFNFIRKCGFSFLLAIVILFTNFYIVTFMFSLERLKFAMIFLFIFLSYDSEKRNNKISLVILSILSHAQLIIFYALLFLEKIAIVLKRLFFSFKINKFFLFMFPFFLVASFSFSTLLFAKILFYIEYYGDNILLGFIKWFVFYVVVFLSSKRKKKVSLVFFILIIPILVLGAERILFYCLILFFMEYKYRTKLYVLFLYPLIVYFMLKSFLFLNNIYMYGHGY